MKELISVIMPYKNCENFLEETLNSILNQNYSNWELIAVNDHSDDKSEEIVNSYSKDDKRIILLKNSKQGIIEALKSGFKMVKGNYITRMDADDIMTSNKLLELKKILDQSSNKTVAIGQVFYFKSNGDKIGNGYLNYQNWINNLAIKQSSFSEIYKECPIPSPSWMMMKEDFECIGAFNSSTYPEDYELAFRMYKHQLTIKATKEVVHHWRDYDSRTSRTDEKYKDNRFLSLKTNSFLTIDYIDKKQLILLGAGKKGKKIAKLLNNNQIDFKWICSTENKIGHSIYNKIIEDSNQIIEEAQIIVAIANKETLLSIKKAEIQSNDYYYFC